MSTRNERGVLGSRGSVTKRTRAEKKRYDQLLEKSLSQNDAASGRAHATAEQQTQTTGGLYSAPDEPPMSYGSRTCNQSEQLGHGAGFQIAGSGLESTSSRGQGPRSGTKRRADESIDGPVQESQSQRRASTKPPSSAHSTTAVQGRVSTASVYGNKAASTDNDEQKPGRDYWEDWVNQQTQ